MAVWLAQAAAIVRRWFRPQRTEAALTWHCQCAGHPFSSEPCRAYFHIAKSHKGEFEIFEDGDDYLLHFPRSMQMPAEWFGSLVEAKDRGLAALKIGAQP